MPTVPLPTTFLIPEAVLHRNQGVLIELAKRIWEDKDFASLPILGDALQEAGVTDTAILEHCRSRGTLHAPEHCPALAAILSPDDKRRKQDPGMFCLPELTFDHWLDAYSSLGMQRQYLKNLSRETFREHTCLDHWLVPMFPGLSCEAVLQGFRDHGADTSSFRDNLDLELADNAVEGFKGNDRDPNRDGCYLIEVSRGIEGEPETVNQSPKQTWEQGHQGITLLEGLFLKYVFWLATGHWLVTKLFLICSGSRFRGGGIPVLRWLAGDRGLYVSGFGARDYSSLICFYPSCFCLPVSVVLSRVSDGLTTIAQEALHNSIEIAKRHNTPAYQEKMRKIREELIRNKGFREPGTDWRDITIV